MLWSRSLTNLLFFSFSVLFIIILSEWTAGDRLPPPRVWLDLAGRLPGPDGGGGGEVPGDGRGRHHLHHLPGQVCGSHSTAGQGQRGGPGCAGGEGHLLSLSQSIRESPYGPECWLAAYFLDIQPCKYSCSSQIFLHEIFFKSSI